MNSYQHTLIRRAIPDELPSYGAVDLSLPLVIHPNQQSGRIIVNYPGYNGNIDGYNGKYLSLAERMQSSIGAVIRMGNHQFAKFSYQESVQDDLRAVITYAIENSDEICGSPDPQIYLIGFSAGASAIAAVCHEYRQVKKILLVSPSGDAGLVAMTEGLGSFTGEVYIAAGANDDVVGAEAAPQISALVKKAAVHRMVIVPNCDHQWKGRENGLFLSNAPIWAFCGGFDFPTTEGGIALY